MNVFPLLTLALAVLAGSPLAQETTAGGNLGSQANWSALQNQLNSTNSTVALVRTDVDQIKSCAAENKIWKPGTGCVLATATAPDCKLEMYSSLNPTRFIPQPQNQGFTCVYSSRWQGTGGQYDSPTDNYSTVCAKVVCK